jgi:hypothetical protein
MIALLVAALLTVFSLAPTPAGLTSSFALNGFTTDASGIQTVTSAPPTIDKDDNGDVVDLSFVSPIKGTCVAVDVVTVNGKVNFIPIGQSPVNKNATAIAGLDLPSDDDVVVAGATPNGYNVMVGCDTDEDTDGSKMIFSNLYHFSSQPSKPA